MATAPDPAVERLFEAAERAHREGRRDEALRALEQILAISPDEPRALNTLALRRLAAGDAATARDMLDRATKAAPEIAPLWLNLARACRAAGDAAAEGSALDAALTRDPYLMPALLERAQLHERQGRLRQALADYSGVLAATPPDAKLPPAMRLALEHGRALVAANRDALARRLDELPLQGDGLDRVRDSVDALLGRTRIYTQQPTFLHFPRVPAVQYYPRESFPWLERLEAATPAIRAELETMLAEDPQAFEPYVARAPDRPVNQWAELNHSTRWGVTYLWRDGRPVEANLARCPATAAALAETPMLDIAGRAPTAFFSLLRPHTHIPPHTGVTNTRLIVHLPLIVPAGCRFRVGSEVRAWEAGKAWVFDDTIEHEAWNDSDELRAVLIFDIWNVYMTDAERAAMRAAMEAIAGHRSASFSNEM